MACVLDTGLGTGTNDEALGACGPQQEMDRFVNFDLMPLVSGSVLYVVGTH